MPKNIVISMWDGGDALRAFRALVPDKLTLDVFCIDWSCEGGDDGGLREAAGCGDGGANHAPILQHPHWFRLRRLRNGRFQVNRGGISNQEKMSRHAQEWPLTDASLNLPTISKGAAQSWQMENRYKKTMVAGKFRFRLRGRLDAQGPRYLLRRGARQRRAAR
jgi:hypothetical protein